ncbi:MAG TPA: hypothetical protein VGC53_12195 [Vicinamibacteria bacterium]
MAYQTIRDVVAHVRALHRRLQHLVGETRTHMDDQRFALLLDFINQHESALEQALEAVEQRGSEAVLNTWLQFEQTAEVDRAMRRSEPMPSGSGDEIVRHVLQTEKTLIRLYQLLQGSTGSPTVQSFFSGLLEMEDSAVRRSARARLEAGDW